MAPPTHPAPRRDPSIHVPFMAGAVQQLYNASRYRKRYIPQPVVPACSDAARRSTTRASTGTKKWFSFGASASDSGDDKSNTIVHACTAALIGTSAPAPSGHTHTAHQRWIYVATSANWKSRANISSMEARRKAGDHDQVVVVGAPSLSEFRSVRQATPSKGTYAFQTIARRDAVSLSAGPFTSSFKSGGTPRKAALALRTALLTLLRVMLN